MRTFAIIYNYFEVFLSITITVIDNFKLSCPFSRIVEYNAEANVFISYFTSFYLKQLKRAFAIVSTFVLMIINTVLTEIQSSITSMLKNSNIIFTIL